MRIPVGRLASSAGRRPSRAVATLASRPRPTTQAHRSFASSVYRTAIPTSAPASSVNPAEVEADSLLNEGSSLLEAGDLKGAQSCYQRSIAVQETASNRYNHGIALYQLKRVPEAIAEWRRSVELEPSADCYTNLASAYVLAEPPQPAAALEALRQAVTLAPDDAEVRFNLGAVNEANGHLAEALQEYTAARDLGIERAEQNIRNVGAKLLRARIAAEESQAGPKST